MGPGGVGETGGGRKARVLLLGKAWGRSGSWAGRNEGSAPEEGMRRAELGGMWKSCGEKGREERGADEGF